MNENLVHVPGLDGLKVMLGAVTAARYAEVGLDRMAAAARALGDTAAVAVVDCPASPSLWPSFLPALDLAVIVLRADAASLDALWRVMPVLRGCGAEERAVLAFNFAGMEGMLPEAECRKAARTFTTAPVVSFLPEDPGVRRAFAQCECYALRNPSSPFCRAVGEILEAVVPYRAETAAKKSFLKPFLGIFSKR
ncbi:MAG: MinD/ParA family ATP-binding protein [Moorellaceae bacterium]